MYILKFVQDALCSTGMLTVKMCLFKGACELVFVHGLVLVPCTSLLESMLYGG